MMIRTMDGDMTPAEFLDAVFEDVWPQGAEEVSFDRTGECEGTLTVTYVLQPFEIEHTLAYPIEVDDLALRIVPFDAVSIWGIVNISAVVRAVDSLVYKDFRLEVTP